METIAIIIFIVLTGLLIISLYKVIYEIPREIKRNREVADFRIRCIDLCTDWNRKNLVNIARKTETSAYKWFFDMLPEYDEMMKDKKPLRFESYFTTQQLNKIFN